MIPNYDKVHNKFKLNNKTYTRKGLNEVAYSFIKEGEPFEKALGDFLADWLDSKDYIKTKTSGTTRGADRPYCCRRLSWKPSKDTCIRQR